LQEIAANVPYPIGDGDHGQIKPAMYENSGVPYIRVADIGWGHFEPKGLVHIPESVHEANLKSELKPGDILIAKTGATIGKCCVVPSYVEKANTTSSVGKISVDQTRMHPQFLLYWFLTPEFQKYLWSISTRAAQPGFNIADMKLFKVPLPPLAEQQRLVDLLDKAFEGIAIAKANAETNLQNALAIFQSHQLSMFKAGSPGWADTALGDICGFVRGPFGGSLRKSSFVNEGYAVYEQQHAIYDQFDAVRYFINEAKFNEMQRFELLHGDLIMSCSGTIGRVAIVPSEIQRGVINQALLKLTPGPKVLNKFLKYWMESEAFQDALRDYSGGAAIQNVASVKILKQIKLLLPTVAEQRKLVEELDCLKDQTQRLAQVYERKIAAIDALKNSLLNRAFLGFSVAA
jgi:type I restriction enzyme S subunit